MHSSLVLWGAWEKSHWHSQSANGLHIDYACIVQRTPGQGQVVGKRSILSFGRGATPRIVSAEKTIRHWCCFLMVKAYGHYSNSNIDKSI